VIKVYWKEDHNGYLKTNCPYNQLTDPENGLNKVRGGLCTQCEYFMCSFITLKKKLNLLKDLK